MLYNFVIPYRNRPDSLSVLTDKLESILNNLGVTNHKIWVIEQTPGKLFNLGILCNCGFDLIKKTTSYKKEDIFVFYPVDWLPIPNVDFSPPKEKTIVWLCDPVKHWSFPTATMMANETFELINGWSDEFWGWGGDDFSQYLRACALVFNIERRQCSFTPNDSSDPRGVVDMSNTENNKKITDEMQNKGVDIWKSGYNTLKYKILSEKECASKNMKHIEVDI